MSDPGQVDLDLVEPILAEFADLRGAVIPILQRVQALYGWLPPEAMRFVSRRSHVPLTRLYGVATFYSQFRLTPRGRHCIQVCNGTTCHIKGADEIIRALTQELAISLGETTADGAITLEAVLCPGSCGLAPVAHFDQKAIGRLNPEQAVSLAKSLRHE
jgi:NADH-quinone oxidoreductase subunit E